MPLHEEYPEEQMRSLLNRIGPSLILWSKELSKPMPRGVPGRFVAFGHWDRHDAGEEELFSLLRELPRERLSRSVSSKEDTAAIIVSSGIMAEPSCFLQSYEEYFSQTPAVVRRWGVTDKDVILEYRAFNWLSPQLHTLVPALLSGATLVISKRFSRSRFFDWLIRHRVTMSAGAPAVINMLLAQPVEVKREEFPNLRFIICSSAKLFPEKQKEFEDRYKIPIVPAMEAAKSFG